MSAHIGLAVMVASDIYDLALASGKPPINFKVTESAESALTKARCPLPSSGNLLSTQIWRGKPWEKFRRPEVADSFADACEAWARTRWTRLETIETYIFVGALRERAPRFKDYRPR